MKTNKIIPLIITFNTLGHKNNILSFWVDYGYDIESEAERLEINIGLGYVLILLSVVISCLIYFLL